MIRSRSNCLLALGLCLAWAALSPRAALAQAAPEAGADGAAQEASPDDASEEIVRELVPTLRLSPGRADFEGGPFPSTLDRDGLRLPDIRPAASRAASQTQRKMSTRLATM